MIDHNTGEVMSHEDRYETVPYNHPKEEPFKEAFNASIMTCKKDVESYFSDERTNPFIKVRYTNWAVEILFGLNHSMSEKFISLCEHIISRNIVFEKSSSLCDILGVQSNHLSRTLNYLKENGLIKERKEHGGKRSWRYLELNPTIVFKTYQNNLENDYGSSSRFNSLHQFYIDQWLMSYIL